MELKDLDFKKMRRWVKEARCRIDEDVVFAFIAAWIGFNYYYSTFAKVSQIDFKNWTNRHCSGSTGDKAQLLFLVNHREFLPLLSGYKAGNQGIWQMVVGVPVKNMLKNEFVPASATAPTSYSKLSNEEIFLTLYQIRNNLFHGDKDPEKDKRDKELCGSACSFLVPLLIYLVENTEGEVLNAYESFSWECSEPSTRQ